MAKENQAKDPDSLQDVFVLHREVKSRLFVMPPHLSSPPTALPQPPPACLQPRPPALLVWADRPSSVVSNLLPWTCDCRDESEIK